MQGAQLRDFGDCSLENFQDEDELEEGVQRRRWRYRRRWTKRRRVFRSGILRRRWRFG